MNARTLVVLASALLPVLVLVSYAIVMHEMSIAPEIVAVVAVRYLFAAGLAAVVALPLYLLWRRAGAASGRALFAFLGLLNAFVLAHIWATVALT